MTARAALATGLRSCRRSRSHVSRARSRGACRPLAAGRHPRHARRRPHRRDVRRPRRRGREGAAERQAAPRGPAGLQALLGRHARGAPREADAVLLGHADARARIDRRQPARGQRRAPQQRRTGSRIRATRRSSLGAAHDDVIKSNDPIRNPYPTVLEFLKAQAGLSTQQVAAFASWDVFNAIVEHTEGALTVNAGFEAFEHRGPTRCAG